MIIALGDLMLDIAVPRGDTHLRGSDCFMQGNISPGGSAANFAVWVARLGGQAGLVAKVGDDLVGRALLQDLASEGVESGVIVSREASGFVVAVVDPLSGERTMLSARGANATLQAEELNWAFLDRADLLHVSAYTLLEEPSRSAALAAMRYVKGRGKQVSLDPAAHGFLRSLGAERFFAWGQGVDILFPNLDEGRALTGEQQPERVLQALQVHFPLVVLKLGPQGAIAGMGSTTVAHPGFAVPVADTTGAGDAFAAAFVVHWLAHHDLAAAICEGNRIAAGVIQVPGARFTAVPPPS